MAINTNTFESNLTTKINATSGTTDAKEFLLLGKAIEAVTPSVVVQDVIDEGTTQTTAVNTAGTTQVTAVNTAGTTQVTAVQTEGATQVAAVQAAGANYLTTSTAASTYAPLAGATFTGAVNGTDLTLSGDLTVNGTQTVLNTATLTVDDLNITIADGAADAAAANGAGITVDGASANITYTSATDTWDFNKAITGTYTNLHPVVATQGVNIGKGVVFTDPMQHFTMNGNTAFTVYSSSAAAGRTAMMILDRSASSYTPSWSSDFKWPDATEPTWTDYRYWIVSMTCLNGTTVLASASGYTV